MLERETDTLTAKDLNIEVPREEEQRGFGFFGEEPNKS